MGWGSDDVPLDLITLLDSTIKSARKTFIYTYIVISVCICMYVYIYIDIWIRMHIDILTSLHAEMSKSLLKMELNSQRSETWLCLVFWSLSENQRIRKAQHPSTKQNLGLDHKPTPLGVKFVEV